MNLEIPYSKNNFSTRVTWRECGRWVFKRGGTSKGFTTMTVLRGGGWIERGLWGGGGILRGGWNVVLRDMRKISIEGWSKWRMS